MPTRNLRLTVAYDGTHYAGWQIQPDHPTIQGELQTAFQRLTQETVIVHSSGRTDAGVHALGQVASLRTECTFPLERIQMGLQHFLPDDIAIRGIDEVPLDFHPAFSSIQKTYRYVMYSSRLREPFLSKYSWRVRPHVDDANMQRAASAIIGRHDFRCFESQGSPRSSTIRTIHELTITRCHPWQLLDAAAIPPENPAGPLIVLEVRGDGFLYNMVRAIAGTLYEIGIHRRAVDSVERIIANGNRAEAGQTAPPNGLFLIQVDYPM